MNITTYAALIGLDWGHERHAIALRPEGGAIEHGRLRPLRG